MIRVFLPALLALHAAVSYAQPVHLRCSMRLASARWTAPFAAIAQTSARARLVVNDPLLISERKRIVADAERLRLPGIYGEREFVEAGGLMFYWASLVDLYHRAAGYAHRIVKGARPSELRVEQPTKFELIVNQKAARAIGIKLPAVLLARADRVIE